MYIYIYILYIEREREREIIGVYIYIYTYTKNIALTKETRGVLDGGHAGHRGVPARGRAGRSRLAAARLLRGVEPAAALAAPEVT